MAMSRKPRLRTRGFPRSVGRLHGGKTLSRVPAGVCGTLAALFQLLQRVGARRFEQPVSDNGRFETDDQERFGSEICDAFQRLVIGTATISEDTGCFRDGKEPCEHGEPAHTRRSASGKSW